MTFNLDKFWHNRTSSDLIDDFLNLISEGGHHLDWWKQLAETQFHQHLWCSNSDCLDSFQLFPHPQSKISIFDISEDVSIERINTSDFKPFYDLSRNC